MYSKTLEYIQKVTCLNSVGILACQSDPHYTLFLVPLWLGKRDEIYRILRLLGIPTVRVTCRPYPKAHRLTMFIYFFYTNINPPLNCIIIIIIN